MLPPDPSHLFVYGTLRPGHAPPLIAKVVARLSVIGPASLPGRLYHLGSYPGCKLEVDGESLIHGQVLHIPDAAALARLDWYEDYVASDQAGSLFVRRPSRATLASGQPIPVWVYEYNRDIAAARLIVSGRYHPEHE